MNSSIHTDTDMLKPKACGCIVGKKQTLVQFLCVHQERKISTTTIWVAYCRDGLEIDWQQYSLVNQGQEQVGAFLWDFQIMLFREENTNYKNVDSFMKFALVQM